MWACRWNYVHASRWNGACGVSKWKYRASSGKMKMGLHVEILGLRVEIRVFGWKYGASREIGPLGGIIGYPGGYSESLSMSPFIDRRYHPGNSYPWESSVIVLISPILTPPTKYSPALVEVWTPWVLSSCYLNVLLTNIPSHNPRPSKMAIETLKKCYSGFSKLTVVLG